jgi:hypothetical protein
MRRSAIRVLEEHSDATQERRTRLRLKAGRAHAAPLGLEQARCRAQ